MVVVSWEPAWGPGGLGGSALHLEAAPNEAPLQRLEALLEPSLVQRLEASPLLRKGCHA